MLFFRSIECGQGIPVTAPAQKQQPNAGISRTPVWPDYFARLGQPDAATWQYQGYWRDTLRVWWAYYTLMIGHPVVAFQGMRHFYQSLVYRIATERAGKIAGPLAYLLTPVMMVLSPFVSLLAVAVMPPILRARKAELPPLFAPFSFMGWANYNIMLITIFTLHSYRQFRMNWPASMAIKHSSKLFWHDFFQANLPVGHRATVQHAIIIDGHVDGEIPRDAFVIKPATGGAGNYLRTMSWDAATGLYHCDDPEKQPGEAATYTPEQLLEWIDTTYIGGSRSHAVIEKLEQTRAPFPVSSIRVMTFNAGTAAELLAAAFLPAPEGSNSTAYFDLDTYLLNYAEGTIGQPVRPQSDGKYTGVPVPEIDGVIEACIAMHNKLPAHVEISWDIILTADGPVYLEANVMPPGCDYKLTVFKKWENFKYLRDRILDGDMLVSVDATMPGGTQVSSRV